MRKRIYILISAFLLLLSNLIAQPVTEIKGVVNKYAEVTSIENSSNVLLSSVTDFAAGDTVMIVQMKGAIYSEDDPNVIDLPANVGKYELTVIGLISGNKVTFNSPLKNTYDDSESVQLVRIPSYIDAVVTEKLTCNPWDGTKGGVLAIIVANSLTLNADIDVTGKGFRGGTPLYYSAGTCFASSGIPSSKFNILNPSADSTSGHKGEGIITNKFIYTLGRAPSGNGGGAGTGTFAGGGGGGNFGIGGNGTRETCAKDEELNWGGNGGHVEAQYFSNTNMHRRIYMGGGGGSGIQKTLSSGSSGGNGGGIVILLTPYVITNGYNIIANGQDVTKLVSDGSSSGGGGGGGMVLLSVDSVKNDLNVSVAGGNGGGTQAGTSCVGQGGGGGAGYVWFSGKTLKFNMLNLSGGHAGQGTCDVSSTAGNSGDSLNRLALPLTGFLNNTLHGSNKTCYNTSQLIKGSRPQGGNGVYTYLWQYHLIGSSTWLPAPGKNDTIDYKTNLLTTTSQFRRIVSSDGMNDVSAVLTINVFPQIFNNKISSDTTLCYGSPSVKISGTNVTGGNGTFKYEWSQRTLSGNWILASGVNNNKDYFPQTDTSRYYRRKATSDYCSTYDSVKFLILPRISNNVITENQTICSESIPVSLSGKTPEGGAGNYSYAWQKSNDSVNWSSSVVAVKDYENFSALSQTTYYRRIISSGINNCCKDTSNKVKITVLPKIHNNSISESQTICEASAPTVFVGSTPTGGDQKQGYRYQWELCRNKSGWDSIQYSTSLINYQSGNLDSTLSFRRIVFSGLNDCCSSISNEIKVTVQPGIKSNIITGDTTICSNSIPALIGRSSDFSGGDGVIYSAQWLQKKPVDTSWQEVQGQNSFNFQPGVLTDSIQYLRVITSGTCQNNSNIVKINVLKLIEGNQITGKNIVCEGFSAEPISSENLSGGEPGIYRIIWEKRTENKNWEVIDGQNSSQLLPGVLNNESSFKRIVKSGPNDCCISLSNIFVIGIDIKPEEADAGIDKDLVYQDTVTLTALKPLIGNGIWSTTSSADIEQPQNFNTKVSGLNFGRNVFTWVVTNGVCPSVMDSVIIHVDDLRRFTGFSPNNDGVNDYFVVDGIDNSPNRDLTIVNRWGVEVYHSANYQNNWDGSNKSSEALPEDTYYYILKVNDIYNPGKPRVYKGFTVIKRN